MMTEDFDLEFNGAYVRIKAGRNGHINLKNTRLWETLADACQRNNCRQVLSEAQIFSIETTYSEGYFVVAMIASAIPAIRIACVVGGHISKDLTDFVALTASNRGISIGFFSKRNEAIDWLGS